MKPTFKKDGTISNRGRLLTPFVPGNKAAARAVVDIATGIEYGSIGEAADALGIYKSTLRNMLCNRIKNTSSIRYKEGGPRTSRKTIAQETLNRT